MYSHFTKLLCAAAFASTALGQQISILSPKPGASFEGGVQITIQLKESPPPNWEILDEVALVIRITNGTFDGTHLGSSDGAFQGKFEAQQTDQEGSIEGNMYANYTITAPQTFDGTGAITLAHYYLLGPYGASILDHTSVPITLYGNSG